MSIVKEHILEKIWCLTKSENKLMRGFASRVTWGSSRRADERLKVNIDQKIAIFLARLKLDGSGASKAHVRAEEVSKEGIGMLGNESATGEAISSPLYPLRRILYG